jgi:DNA-binding IclR family transcriptional regulator
VAAWEVGQGYTRQEPLSRLARLPIAKLVDTLGVSAHLAVLHGSDVVYLIEERAKGRARLVTDVGVRMPAHLTASGRAILAGLPAAQVRALFPTRAALVQRTGVGPKSLPQLRSILATARRLGYADEDSEITSGFASVAIRLDSPSNLASVALTWETPLQVDRQLVLDQLRDTAATIDARLR